MYNIAMLFVSACFCNSINFVEFCQLVKDEDHYFVEILALALFPSACICDFLKCRIV